MREGGGWSATGQGSQIHEVVNIILELSFISGSNLTIIVACVTKKPHNQRQWTAQHQYLTIWTKCFPQNNTFTSFWKMLSELWMEKVVRDEPDVFLLLFFLFFCLSRTSFSRKQKKKKRGEGGRRTKNEERENRKVRVLFLFREGG